MLNHRGGANKPLSDGRWELAWDCVYNCDNSGVASYTKMLTYPSSNNLYDMQLC